MMKLPNAPKAIVDEGKVKNYLLNINHRRGGAKAKLFQLFGYSSNKYQKLIEDIRTYHLDKDVTVITDTIYGMRYEIKAELNTPSGKKLNVRSVWQIDIGNDIPRLITLIPD